MLQKWKQIIRNWINCYFSESNQDERSVNIESLLNIISHLHENLNLDESKSSILEAHTVEEFVLEKYPEFKYENDTVEESNEDEIYLVASLLLFFVCVNSKDVDIKSAMCSKLSGDDQETILKFTKCLLDCSPITRMEVHAAITEACGLEMASGHAKVAETPPALRSLHGEVRRLQAALDAERFDRNYLQDELARTNLRMDKLSKDKEQYKLEIVNLKAKISMCCGQEQDSRGAEAEAESSGKLQRQLQEMEERLVRTQEMLDDAAYERDAYKTKVEELRQDRDKWLSLSQQESGRAAQLSDELELERRHMQSLKELVAELRQHNRRNGLDSSQLECDDPDASVQSLQHNLSVCSEACANVVEVQLSEEKAKVDALKQQLERIQDDMNEMSQKYENDKHNLESVLSERENDIFNLKHRINEEIEEKNHLKSYYNDEISKLNNEINELEQKIKDNNDHSRIIIDKKIQEIKTLQEEKFSLLQSLSNETTKLENIIAGLKAEIATEKQARIHMRDGYENQMMKLNEKVLNRNNELVELQNNVFEKGEMIETLQMDLRNEKEISSKYHIDVCQLHEQKREVENKLHDKNEEMTAMQLSLEQNIASVLKEIEHFKLLVANLQDHCRSLEQSKAQLEFEINSQTIRFEELLKETENIKKSYTEELEKLKIDLDEKNAIINTLQTHLHDEIHCKIGYQEELQKLQANKLHMSEELNKLTVEFSKQKIELTGKDRTIESLEMCLKEAKDTTGKLQADNDKLNLEISKLSNEIDLRNNNIELLNNTLKTTKKSLEDELSDKIATIEYNNQKLANVTTKKQALQSKVDLMYAEKTKQDLDLVEKSKQITQLQAECEKMAKAIEENKKAIRSLDQNMTKEKQKYAALEKSYDSEMTKLMGKLNETEKTIKELSSSSKKAIKTKDHHIQTLTGEVENLKKELNDDKENMSLVHKEKEMLTQKLSEEISFKNKIEKEYQNQCLLLDNITSQLNEEIATKNNEIITLKMELELAMKTIETKCKEVRTLQQRLTKEDQLIRDLAHQKTVETKDLQKRISHLQSLNNELEKEVKREYDCKKQAVEALQKENEQLHFAMEEDNSNHEVLLKEKDCIIDRLEGQLKVHTVQLESIRKDYENITLSWEIYKVDTKETIEAKEKQINKLTQEVVSLQQTLSDVKTERDELIKKLDVITQEMKDAETKNKQELEKLVETIAHVEMKSAVILKEKEDLQNQLIEEKAAIENLQTEKKQLSEDMKVLVADKNELQNEKIELTQYLAEERTVKKIFEEERNALESENATLERKLLQQVTTTETLLEDKECLTQQLVEEKSARELSEKEKENLFFEKQLIEQKLIEVENNKEEMSKEIDQLMEKHSLLDQQCMKERTANEILEENLKAEQTSNAVLFKENEIQIAYLNIEIESLQQELRDQNTVQEALVTDKELLLSEKEELLKTLGLEKSEHDEKETEKDQMITKLCELNETYSSKASNIQADLDKVTENMNSLQMDIKNQEELNNQITTTLSVGLENLLQRLKEKTISNEVLQKILQSDNTDSQATVKCGILINIANTIFTEMEMRQNVEKALENSNMSLEELKSILKQRDMQLFELQTEIKRLQQIVNENKIELSKRTETFNTTLDNKVREMHAVQEENQSLTNDLNDVKLQLELKVHSLKEKLIDNENLTDKLKNTYECQIDNLNVMITKLTNYLKDKTAELDTVRKEKERVTQALEEKSQAIKALEDEIKNEIQNQQKLLKDFDSERQVLKNMITVTESVMEDQKVTLNNIISEHVRASEILQKENKAILEEFESERKGFAAKLQEKENSLESLFKEMAEIRLEKEKFEKEIKSEKEASIKEMKNLEAKLQEKENSLESLSKEMAEIRLEKEKFEKEIKAEKEASIKEMKNLEAKLQEKENSLESLFKEMAEIRLEKEKFEKEIKSEKEASIKEMKNLEAKLQEKENSLESLSKEMTEIRLEKGKFEKEIKAEKEASIKEINNLETKQQENENSLESLSKEMAEIKLEKDRFEKEIKAQKETSVKEINNLRAKLQDDENALEALSKEMAEIRLDRDGLEKEIKAQKEASVKERNNLETKLQEKENSLELLFKETAEIKLEKEKFEKEIKAQKEASVKEINNLEAKLQDKVNSLESLSKEMSEIRLEKERFEKELKAEKEASVKEINNLEAKIQVQESALDSVLNEIYGEGIRPNNENIAADIKKLKFELQTKVEEFNKLQEENSNLSTTIQENKNDMVSKENRIKELAATEMQLRTEIAVLKKSLEEITETNKNLDCTLKEKTENIKEMEEKANLLLELVKMAEQDKKILEEQKNALILENKGTESNVHFLESNITMYGEEIAKLNIENINLVKTVEDNNNVISNLEQLLKDTQEQNKKLCEELNIEKMNLVNKCAILQEYHDKAEIELEKRQKETISIEKELNNMKCKVELCEEDSRAKDAIVSKISKEKDAIIASISKELLEAKAAKEKCEKEIQEKMATIQELKQNLDDINNEREALHILRKENEELIKAVGQRETFAAAQSQERVSSQKQSNQAEKELRDLQHQVDNTSSDMSHTSTESLKTISDLEKIILDKNRTITTLQSDVTYLKTLLAESETKLLDITKEFELSKENCHQLSTQLKKIVHQKNEELADLKRQVSKMSVNENRATQIIKVSAKYQAIILKRIAEIKTNTVLKELTNFGNSNNYDTEVKRSLSAGTVTMEDLENFLETTDRHLRKCSEKQLALQKERDRLTEVNRIHETEILNLKKLVSEQTLSFKALSAAREAYLQKVSNVTTLQRTVRRAILRVEGSLGAAALAALERAHAAALQDLAEAALALERWHERAVRRALAPERAAPAGGAALDVQLDELADGLARLLQRVEATREGGAGDKRDAVAEVRAEYEDKLDRMKSKMKQLYTEQIAVFKQKQRLEMASLERELACARDKLAESSRAYEEHIRGLTAELWSVGEKFLMKKDEAEWLRRKQRSGSLMSLQHVHSSGLVPFKEEPARPSDSQSLRSLPVNNNGSRREGRTMHMSDEEGEVFDNRWLKELSATPRRESLAQGPRESGVPGHRDSRPPGMRLSELQWRNSLCPPHLKSSYPAETQFTPAVDEEDIKFIGPAGVKPQRKEVGITAYKKPGPPTPSKQAGRLSATDSELRESLRVEAEPQPSRKNSTPSRIRALFRSSKNDTAEGTPRSRRLSNIFRKK